MHQTGPTESHVDSITSQGLKMTGAPVQLNDGDIQPTREPSIVSVSSVRIKQLRPEK